MSKSYEPQDPYFLRAKREGYLARSVYKLKEIHERFQLLGWGQAVVDLGAAPGSWSQYLAAHIGPQGKIYSIDLQPLQFEAPQVQFFAMDVFSPEIEALLSSGGWDGLVSDLGPATCGTKSVDHLRSVALARRSLELAVKYVRSGGFWVAKVLEGERLPLLRREAQKRFAILRALRPRATRSTSREIYLIGKGKL